MGTAFTAGGSSSAAGFAFQDGLAPEKWSLLVTQIEKRTETAASCRLVYVIAEFFAAASLDVVVQFGIRACDQGGLVPRGRACSKT